mmetsp:Transcript_25355/g.41640  ORF Transcript_25355/g.41640 Transcript_25355/m.41640 type:complete len:226 (+) Transcript_25355:770-1447(+)
MVYTGQVVPRWFQVIRISPMELGWVHDCHLKGVVHQGDGTIFSQLSAQSDAWTAGDATYTWHVFATGTTFHSHKAVLAPSFSPTIPCNPVSDRFVVSILVHYFFLSVSHNEQCMIWPLVAINAVKDATTVIDKGRIGPIQSYGDRSNVFQCQFDHIFVISMQEAPTLYGRNGIGNFVQWTVLRLGGIGNVGSRWKGIHDGRCSGGGAFSGCFVMLLQLIVGLVLL